MSTKKIICSIVVSGIAIILFWLVGSYFSYNNKEIGLREEATAQIKKIETVHDKMWKIISQKAQISNDYKHSFDTIYNHIMSARYQSGGSDGSLMKWIKESNPNFDTSLYKDLANSVEVYRNEFQESQERIFDIQREHDVLCKTYPGKWFISNTSPIEYKVISSTVSKEAMETGIEDDVKLF